MAIPRGVCTRDDARFTPAVVACFDAKENQIACITRGFRSSFKGISSRACGQNIVTGDPAVNPAPSRAPRVRVRQHGREQAVENGPVPRRGAAWNAAPQSRGRFNHGVRDDPGSATQRCTLHRVRDPDNFSTPC